MKFIISLFACLLFLTSFVDGGDQEPSPLVINFHEPSLNLQYRGLYDTIEISVIKNKPVLEIMTSNVAIIRASSDSVTYLFNDGKKRDILHFCFESEYLEKYRTMVFNNEHYPNDEKESNLFDYSNNRNLDSRHPADALIILTEEFVGKKQILWKSTKSGAHLVQLTEIAEEEEWEIDVKNKQIRVSAQIGSKLRIRSYPY